MIRLLFGIFLGFVGATLFWLFWVHSSVQSTNSLIPNTVTGFWTAVAAKTIIWSITDPSNIYSPSGTKIGTIGLDGTVYDMNHNVIIPGVGSNISSTVAAVK